MDTSRYTTVAESAKKVAIVATGESLKGVTLEFNDDVKVLAVNSAISYVHRVDFWFTLDPSPSNLAIMRAAPVRGVSYYAALPEDGPGVPSHVKVLRRVAGTGHGRYRTKPGLSPDKGAIHTGNSAWGALQLAAHFGAEKVALFGVDGHGGYHYGGKPRELGMMTELFESARHDLALRNISVVNGSPKSIVDAFIKPTPEEAMKWINS